MDAQCGFVTGLDYENPHVSPYHTFQTWKTHPKIKEHLEGGERVEEGGREREDGVLAQVKRVEVPVTIRDEWATTQPTDACIKLATPPPPWATYMLLHHDPS